jgi:hypothetical protein
LVLSGLLLLFFTVIAFTPTPLQPQYFAAPIPFLFIFLAVLLRRARTGISSIWQDRGAFALVAISLAISAPPIVSNSLAASTIGNWAGISYHRTAHEVRRILETQTSIAPHHTNVATLSPLYALEANLPIYEELATGAFLYRVGDLLTAEERLRYVGTSPDTIHALLDRDPPAAILVGYYTNHPLEYLEQPLVEYARTRNYRAIVADVFPENIVLYVRSAP